jgi:hypothetical protein
MRARTDQENSSQLVMQQRKRTHQHGVKRPAFKCHQRRKDGEGDDMLQYRVMAWRSASSKRA